MNGPITFKSRNGMLFSKLPIGNVLRERLGPIASKNLAKTIRFAEREKWVLYRTDLLGDKELDDKLAHDLVLAFDLPHPLDMRPKVIICDPKTIQTVRDFKKKPVQLAKELGYEEVIKKLLGRSQPAGIRRKWYEIFDRALDIDERERDINKNAFNMSLYLPSLFIELRDKGEACSKLADILWFDPKHDESQSFDWIAYHRVEPRNGTFKETPYYNDTRFIALLDELIKENWNVRSRDKGPDRP